MFTALVHTTLLVCTLHFSYAHYTSRIHTTLLVYTLHFSYTHYSSASRFESTQLRLIDLSLDQLSTNSLLCRPQHDSSPCSSSSAFLLPFFLKVFQEYIGRERKSNTKKDIEQKMRESQSNTKRSKYS